MNENEYDDWLKDWHESNEALEAEIAENCRAWVRTALKDCGETIEARLCEAKDEGRVTDAQSEEQAKLRARSVIHWRELTDKWASHGISAPRDFARLTDRESRGVFRKSTSEMKRDRNLPATGNLRDKMTKPELAAQDVADVAISLLIDKHNPYGYTENCTEVDKGSAVGARLLADLQRTLEA